MFSRKSTKMEPSLVFVVNCSFCVSIPFIILLNPAGISALLLAWLSKGKTHSNHIGPIFIFLIHFWSHFGVAEE